MAGPLESGDIHELLVEPHPVGGQGAVLASHAGRAGERRGAWSTDSGPLNRVVSLWSGVARPRPEEDPAADDWLHPRVLARRLQPRRALRTELLSEPILELRLYALRPGQCDSFLEFLAGALHARERYSPCAGIWKSAERGVELAVHLWAYGSLEHRSSARAAAAQDGDWAAYRARIPSMLANMQAWQLLPLVST